MRSSHVDTLTIPRVTQRCSLSQVAPTHNAIQGFNADISGDSPLWPPSLRRRHLSLEPPEAARHWEA